MAHCSMDSLSLTVHDVFVFEASFGFVFGSLERHCPKWPINTITAREPSQITFAFRGG